MRSPPSMAARGVFSGRFLVGASRGLRTPGSVAPLVRPAWGPFRVLASSSTTPLTPKAVSVTTTKPTSPAPKTPPVSVTPTTPPPLTAAFHAPPENAHDPGLASKVAPKRTDELPISYESARNDTGKQSQPLQILNPGEPLPPQLEPGSVQVAWHPKVDLRRPFRWGGRFLSDAGQYVKQIQPIVVDGNKVFCDGHGRSPVFPLPRHLAPTLLHVQTGPGHDILTHVRSCSLYGFILSTHPAMAPLGGLLWSLFSCLWAVWDWLGPWASSLPFLPSPFVPSDNPALGHPRVWIDLRDPVPTPCPYCYQTYIQARFADRYVDLATAKWKKHAEPLGHH